LRRVGRAGRSPLDLRDTALELRDPPGQLDELALHLLLIAFPVCHPLLLLKRCPVRPNMAGRPSLADPGKLMVRSRLSGRCRISDILRVACLAARFGRSALTYLANWLAL
jgi:hypothetical protein